MIEFDVEYIVNAYLIVHTIKTLAANLAHILTERTSVRRNSRCHKNYSQNQKINNQNSF
jgi:hypothetical protein